MKLFGRLSPFALVALLAAPALAQQGSERWSVDGNVLSFNTEHKGSDAGIERSDVDRLLRLLRDNPAVEVLRLNSTGGGLYAALDMADIVIDFELDTAIDAVCESSCMYVFLGGESRTMARGGRVGFHRVSWSADSIESYYDNHSEEEGWATPFEFTSWIYEDTQVEVYNILSYMVGRGVDPSFAIETLKAGADEMWSPYRPVLMAAGVLTE
ncbi:MAG: hypothetical protein AAGI10_11215 [Pseudomonadota bacterium]